MIEAGKNAVEVNGHLLEIIGKYNRIITETSMGAVIDELDVINALLKEAGNLYNNRISTIKNNDIKMFVHIVRSVY